MLPLNPIARTRPAGVSPNYPDPENCPRCGRPWTINDRWAAIVAFMAIGDLAVCSTCVMVSWWALNALTQREAAAGVVNVLMVKRHHERLAAERQASL